MPRVAVLGLVVGGVLLVAVVGYMLLVKPQQKRLATVKQQIADTQKKIDDYRSAASTQQAPPNIRVADIYRLSQAMPASVDMPDVLLELDDVAKSAGIELTSIAPQTPQPGAGFTIQPITLQFSGDYYAVTDLLYRLRTLVAVRHGQLEASGRIFAIQSVDLSPVGSELQANLTVDTYVYGGTPVPAVAAPVPTDTTATTGTTDTTATDTTSTSASALPAQGGN